MARKSIGDLHATVTADAVQFVGEFKRADNEARRSAASIKKTLSQQFGDELGKTGKKFALGFLGAAGLGAIIGEVREVARNIDNIPGVPSSTIESIRTMNYEFAKTKLAVDQAVARFTGFVAGAVNYAGAIAGAISTGGSIDDVNKSIEDLNSEGEAFARSGFVKQLGALNAELDRLNQEAKGNGFRKGIGIEDLDKEADALANLAKTGVLNLKAYTNAKLEALNTQFSAQGGVTQGDRDAAALDAVQNRIKVQQALNDATKEYAGVLDSTYEVRQRDQLSLLGTNDAIDAQRQKLEALSQQLARAFNSDLGGVEKQNIITKLTKDISETEHQLFQLTHAAKTASQEIRDSFVGAFDSLASEIADFVVDGEFKLSNFTDAIAKSVVQTLAKLAIINPILNGLFGGTAGWQALPALFGGAHADGGRPDVGKISLIGEKGPELWVPDTAGTIIPNHALASMGSSGGNTYVIDARGADVGAVARVEQALFKLAGPGVVEKRALAASANERQRGGGIGRSLGV